MNGAPTKARQAALYVLGRCRAHGSWSPQTLSTAVERFGLDRRDAALCTRLCRAVLQNAALCDFYIDCFSSVKSTRLEPRVRDVLRLGVCQLLFTDKVPKSAAVSESVELVRSAGIERAAGLVNAVLRRVSEQRGSLPEIPGAGTPEYLAVRYSHPLWLCRRLVREKGYGFTEAFLEANNTEAPLGATVNTLKTTTAALREEFAQQGIAALPHPYTPDSLLIDGAGDPSDWPAIREGRCFIQDAGAALTAHAAGARPGMRVLDGCAAPGGKSFLCGIRMTGEGGQTGEILSCDLHANKLRLVREGAERLGLPLIRTGAMDAADPDKALWNAFDLVLADVPCSGLGVIRKKPEIREKDPAALAGLPPGQLRILRGLSRCVRPGGLLLYSTCTVLEEENAGVIRAFLRENSEYEAEPFTLGEALEAPDGMITLWPHVQNTDGFFICRLRRRDNG
jgi:16S rRNA (cytosine967-C5)-methyltransferase